MRLTVMHKRTYSYATAPCCLSSSPATTGGCGVVTAGRRRSTPAGKSSVGSVDTSRRTGTTFLDRAGRAAISIRAFSYATTLPPRPATSKTLRPRDLTAGSRSSRRLPCRTNLAFLPPLNHDAVLAPQHARRNRVTIYIMLRTCASRQWRVRFIGFVWLRAWRGGDRANLTGRGADQAQIDARTGTSLRRPQRVSPPVSA